MELIHYDKVEIPMKGLPVYAYNVVIGLENGHIGFLNYSDILFTDDNHVPIPPLSRELVTHFLEAR